MDWDRYEQECHSPLGSVWRRMAPDAYLNASVAMVKGKKRSGMCRTGLDRKRHLR